MKIIGITGGVGAGKSHILDYIETHYKARIIKTDEAAELLRTPGHACYDKIVAILGTEILKEDGTIDKNKMAQAIFTDPKKLIQVNQVIHPGVNQYVAEEIEKERNRGEKEYFFVESALLIENHYDEICDQLWYISTKESVRIQRLEENRGYSKEKIADIMKRQLSEEEFLKHCSVVIDNNKGKEDVYEQIQALLGKPVESE